VPKFGDLPKSNVGKILRKERQNPPFAKL